MDRLSYARREKGVSVAPMVAHMPSLTILMPAYAETMVRGWMSMFRQQEDHKLSDFAYMTEKRNDELRNLVLSMTAAERRAIEPYVQLSDIGGVGEVLVDISGLRDSLLFSDHLLTLAKAGALQVRESRAANQSGKIRAGPDGEAPAGEETHVMTSLRVSRLVLDCAMMDGRAPGPAAPEDCQAEVIASLAQRREVMEQVAELGVPGIIDLVRCSMLRMPSPGDSTSMCAQKTPFCRRRCTRCARERTFP